MFEDRIEDRFLDMTNDELIAHDDFPADEELASEEEFREKVGEIHQAFEVYAGATLINKMFDDGYLTLGEYLELVEYVEEYERDMDSALL